MPIATPVAGALIGGATSLVQNALNSYSVKKQNEMNMANWREQNDYNTPSAQRKRMEDAGLNPALMYGQGSTGNAQAAPNTERNGIDITQIGSIINTFLELKKKDADIENTRKDIETKYIENMYRGKRLGLQNEGLENEELESGFRVGKYGRGFFPQSEDIPMIQRYDNELSKLKQDLEIGKLRKSSIGMDNQREQWEFQRDREDKKLYDINPRDPDNVRVVKKLLKQTFNKRPEDLLDILGSLFRK